MAKKESEGVRIGPITLVTLISVLLLAVLAVLCVTTANATQAMAQRHAEATTESYALDACGQAMLAGIGDMAHGSASPADAANAVSANLESIKADAQAKTQNARNFSLEAQVDGTQVAFTVSAESGKTLTAKASLGDTGALSVDEWKISTTQTTDEETLWSGESATQ